MLIRPQKNHVFFKELKKYKTPKGMLLVGHEFQTCNRLQ